MRFITSTLFAVAALAGLVMGDENPIIYPDASSKIVAGYPFVITWTPTTPGTVTFTLRQGPSDNLKDVETIVSGTENDGTYEWTPKKSLPAGTNYAIKITDSAGNINYTPLITIQSDAPSTGTSTGTGTGTGIDAGNGVGTGTGTGTGTGIGSGGVSSLTASSGASTITAAPPAAVNPVYSNSTLTTVSTGYSNSTATGNLTHSSTRSSNPSTTSTSTEEPVPTGAASSLLKSPLALVVCVLGAVLYLN